MCSVYTYSQLQPIAAVTMHMFAAVPPGVEWIGLRADCKLDGSKANISGGAGSTWHSTLVDDVP